MWNGFGFCLGDQAGGTGRSRRGLQERLREIVMVVYSCLRMDDFFVTQRERGLHHRRAETLTAGGTN